MALQVEQLITDHLDLWTQAQTAKSTSGRGSNNKIELTGIKKLRELILELAVRGKLVPQDPNDEPASELLKRISAEKEALVKAGKLKKQKPLPPIMDEEKPFELPMGWQWVRLGEIAEAFTGYAFKSSQYTPEGVFVLRVTNINPDGSIDSTDAKYISLSEAESSYKNFELEEGDVLLVMVGGSLGKIGIVSKGVLPAVLNQNMWKLKSYGGICSDFFINGLKHINTHQVVITSSTHGHLAQGEYLSKLVPLAPITEQSRLSLRYKELMALCDQLEQQSYQQLDAHNQLVDALLATLTQSQNADDLASNWQRLAAYFDTLFTTEYSINALKQTILQLAVMGKLVKQDPNDEPASELLKRIAAEKDALVKAGKIKKQKPLPPISDDEKPFELPEGWEWVRFGDLVSFESELVNPDSYQEYEQIAPDSIEKGTGRLLFRRTVAESGIRGPNNRFYAGQILYSKIRPSLSKAVIADFDGLCSADMYPLRVTQISPEFLLRQILSEFFLQQVRREENRIKMPKLNMPTLSAFKMPLPPFNEQLKIVTKVELIFGFVDELSQKICTSKQIQAALAETMVEQVVT